MRAIADHAKAIPMHEISGSECTFGPTRKSPRFMLHEDRIVIDIPFCAIPCTNAWSLQTDHDQKVDTYCDHAMIGPPLPSIATTGFISLTPRLLTSRQSDSFSLLGILLVCKM